MAHQIHMSLPTAYFDDEQQQQLLASYASSWAQPPPLQPVCAPQFAYPGPDQFSLHVQTSNFPSSFRMPSPPVSPSLSSLSGSSFSTESVTTPTGFVSLANIQPPRNDTVFGWNSVAVAEPEPLSIAVAGGSETGRKTVDQTLRSRSTLKRPASPSPTPSLSSSSSTSPAPMQQPESTPAPSSAGSVPAPKRQRTQISSKDFVPPDVTGLSKREARLVKNRAAAFLSRQRKREEFEELEKHCQDLERENARLQTTVGQSPSKKLKASESDVSQDTLAELARLRESNAQLAAQNAQLSAQNAQLTAENARLAQQQDVHPKVEDDEESMLLSEPPVRKETKEKHGTGSVALMVLMISLSLLGKPLASGVSNARGRPALTALQTASAPQPSSTFDFVLPRTNSDYEWLTSPTDLEHDDFAVPSASSVSYTSQQPASPTTRTLTVQGLENLDIPTDIRDFNFEMDVDERDARNVVLAVSNPGSSTSSDASSLSSPSSTSISTLDSAWPEPSVDSTMAMLGGDYMSYDYDSDIFATPIQPQTKQQPAGTRKIAVAVVPSSGDGQGRWSVEVKESL